MNDERYVAAIETSSSKIIAAIGKMHDDGQLEIIATEQERGVESIRYGIVQNLEETARRVGRVLDRLQRRPGVGPRVITGVYVGLSGRSLRSIRTEVEINLPEDTEISTQILQQLRERALNTAIDSSLEVIDAIPRSYIVGKLETHSPKGAIGNKIHATYDLIVCRPDLRRNLQRTISDKLGININGFIVTALSTAQIILSSEEKRLGCMLVDMGAETTTVSIYKDGSLIYFATLPLGGRNITRDITSIGELEERCEDIKMRMGNAIACDTMSSVNVNGLKMSEVSNLIVARSEEIVANIVEQLKYAGIKDSDLLAGLVCIGGGSRLNGMLDLLARQTDLPVRRGQLPSYIHNHEAKSMTSDEIQVTSILYAGGSSSDADCLSEPGAPELPVTGEGNEDEIPEELHTQTTSRRKNANNIFSRLSTRISEIFKSPEEDNSDLLDD